MNKLETSPAGLRPAWRVTRLRLLILSVRT